MWSRIYQLVCSIGIGPWLFITMKWFIYSYSGHDLWPGYKSRPSVLGIIKHELNESGFLFRFIIGFSMNLTYDSWQQVNTNSIYLFRMFNFGFFPSLNTYTFFEFIFIHLHYLFIQLIKIHYVIFFSFFSTENHVFVCL